MSEGHHEAPSVSGGNFIENIIAEDLRTQKHQGKIQTRFPPEPNGYLHIGHARSVCLNFGIAQTYKGGLCNLRFDDTNPEKEDIEYQNSIMEDIRWLGFDWGERLFHASDYYEKFFQFAVELIRKGLAYVCDLSAERIRETRGTLTESGSHSPYRDRTVDENLLLFNQMREGHFRDGEKVLRAKIDMSSGNINMRDPVIYRIKKVRHHRTGNAWCIYPMYDFAHCLSDYLEGITHSLCTLEFQDHRPLYDWFIQNLVPEPHPRQYEFARLNLNYTVTSKRKLKQLVDERHVRGWDDPRLPTICGLRRRGYTPSAIRTFCERLGVSKKETVIDMGVLEDCLRDDLNATAKRAMCVLNPLKVTITNYPEGQTEEFNVRNHPKDDAMGRRSLAFSRQILIERDDFLDDPPAGYHRLAPGREVRLRYGYVIRCDEVVRDEDGEALELKCTYDPDTGNGKKPVGRQVKGIIHWVSAGKSLPLEIRLYDRLFNVPFPTAEEKEGRDFREHLNPSSLLSLHKCRGEWALKDALPGQIFQFERLGYFCIDSDSSDEEHLIFNRSVTLRDTWQQENSAP
ncbi:MAG: glutamine--tRNA ligase/YqeY domain fusion protein [Deltaproteobacteria bacterium]|nr:glutamine--tRNA ligase/YqeY domain fusion protein [Deltaproteobacteria bacterium]